MKQKKQTPQQGAKLHGSTLQSKWALIKQALYLHYHAPQQLMFKQFRNGAIFFAVGVIIVYLANTTVEPSVKQEWLVLAGLIMAGAGFVVAILAHVRLIISRLVKFIDK
ncbi:hypothetical protein [Teredinibacter waterburyi]|jgi:hypothetical protein|uniref:hypothetical protein n=1 Tax=Teredinibacter waterburyi TaxID=1500538 RepID=UPI001FE56907|nr:hypothetical protein [Teredinibacter waterburyi]